MLRKTLGPEHPDATMALNNLAHHLDAQADYAGAEALLREALRTKLFGNRHPETASSHNNLASLLWARGDTVGAEDHYREALAMWREIFGDEHPDVVLGLGDLSRLLHVKGEYEEAELLQTEAATVYDVARLRAGAGLKRATFQASPHPRLAAARLALGQDDEAWPAAEKALARSLTDLLMVAEQRDRGLVGCGDQ